MSANTFTQAPSELKPARPFFIGIDSDGCAFDTMEIKHKECFCPQTIKHWNLQAVSKYARETFEFVNLYSQWRGANRWPALIKVFELLSERPEVAARGAEVPPALALRAFIASGRPLSNAGLEVYMAEVYDPELEQAHAWSDAVNDAIADIVRGVPPFPGVRESLQMMQGTADLMVVSATPGEALAREWEEHHLAQYTRLIAGQEMGSKKQLLALAAEGKYAADHILMIGDALGDLQAAQSVQALFFPINPGAEEKSWERFYREGFYRFLQADFAGDYQAELLAEFEGLLPSVPPWKRT